MKFTNRQREVLTRMSEGWELSRDTTINVANLSKDGETQRVELKTYFSLVPTEYIAQVPGEYPLIAYQLTDKGREALIQKTCPVF